MTTRAAARPLRRNGKARVRAAALPASYTMRWDTAVSGEVGSPNRQELTAVPLTLIEAVNAAAGFTASADRRRAEEAYLLGEISTPDVMDLSLEPITLTQAVTRQGEVLRVWTRVFQLDVTQPAGLLLGTRFVLEPGDVVHALRSPLQRWNDTISRLLPTVQAYSAAQGLTD